MRVAQPAAALAASRHGPRACCCGPNYQRLRRAPALSCRCGSPGSPASSPGRSARLSVMDVAVGARRRRCPTGLYTGAGIEKYVAEVLADPDRTDDFRLLEHELYLTRDRPRHVRADRLRRRRLGRRADLDGGRRLDGAADGLRAGRDQRPRADRRRHPLDHQRRHRGREGRQVHRRRQPARPLRQRLQEADPDDLRQPRPPRLRHGLRADRQPGLQAARPRPPAPRRRGLGSKLPGRRHHPDRARARRRADVRRPRSWTTRRAWRSPGTASSR